MFNMKFRLEVLELFIIKLSAIVSDDDSRKAESTDDGLPHEFCGLGLSDLSHQLGSYPFGKVINNYE